MAKAMQILLTAAVKGKVSMIISGGTGSRQDDNAERAFVADFASRAPDHDRGRRRAAAAAAACRPAGNPAAERSTGSNEIRQRELLKNALRMRPDRIIVGEVRGEEAFDMLQAMNTGHEGSMTTIHANTPRDAVSRLEQMVGMAGMPMSQLSIRAPDRLGDHA